MIVQRRVRIFFAQKRHVLSSDLHHVHRGSEPLQSEQDLDVQRKVIAGHVVAAAVQSSSRQ